MNIMEFNSNIEINNPYGIINTVRAGSKWYDALKVGEEVYVKINGRLTGMCGDEYARFPQDVHIYFNGLRLGIVTKLECKKFCDLKAEDIRYNFHSLAREYEELLEEMKDIYPGFSEDSEVTVVNLHLIPKFSFEGEKY